MSETAEVTRTRSVLTLLTEDAEAVMDFMGIDDDVDAGAALLDHDRPHVRISRTQWEDLGAPTYITVAIWPEDRQDIMEGELPQ